MKIFVFPLILLIATMLSAASVYQEREPADGGVIKGKVLWKSDPPVPQTVPVTKDQKICGESKTVPGTTIGKNGEVRNAVVYLEGITSGKRNLPVQKVQLDQKNCEYIPHILIVPPGAEVEILNSDPMLHNVHAYSTADKPSTTFNLAFPVQGQKVTKKLTETGKILSLCDAGHPWMSAYIFPTEHPYYAITDAQGNFSLDNVSPGKYTLRLWYEGVAKLENNSNAGLLKTQPRESSKQVSVSKKATITINFEL